MSDYNEDMMPKVRQNEHGQGYPGRGRGNQTFDNPYGQTYGSHRGGSFSGGARGYQRQNYSYRGNRGRSQGGRWQRGQRGGGQHRGRGQSNFQSSQQEFRPSDYVIPEMTMDPWKQLLKQYEAEKKAGNA